MLRKPVFYLPAGLALLLSALLAGYLFRPITIFIDNQPIRVQSPVWTAGQALFAAGVSLAPNDQVEPPLNALIPINGHVQVHRAAHVTFWDNGQVHSVSAPAKSPAELLRQAGLSLGPRDRLLWNGQALMADASLPAARTLVIQILRARTLVVDKNGQQQTVTSTAPSVARALWDAGLRLKPGDRLSSSPDQAPVQDAVIGYQEAHSLTIQTAGEAPLHTRSTAASVGEALAQAGVFLQGLDYAVPAENQPLPADGNIRVVRVREEIQLKETLIPFDRETVKDDALPLDQRQTQTAGQYGVQVTRERIRYEDNQETARGVDSDWVASPPVNEVVGIGTKVVPLKLDTPEGPIEYWRAVNVYATSYSPCTQTGTGNCSWSTSSGIRLTKGVIAVTLSWYRIISGLQVYVPGYGKGIIADVGGGIPGTPWIDLGFDEDTFASQSFVGWTTLYFLTPAPANVSWTLP